MTDQLNTAETAETKLVAMLKSFQTAMLVTNDRSGDFHARPMHLALVGDDGTAYFATSAGSPKTADISDNMHALVTLQSASQFAVVSGVAQVITDPALAEKLWSEAWKVWFPLGSTDPSLRFVKLTPIRGEYWDNSGVNGWKYVAKAISAIATGHPPKTDATQNAKVRFAD